MTRPKILIGLASVVILGAVVFFILQPGGNKESEVLVLCGGSMRAALEEVIKDYRAVSSDNVMMTVGGSGELCAQMKFTHKGDVYVCHDPFMPWAAEQGLIHEWRTVARFWPAIVVPKGNPDGIKGLADLARPGLKIGIGDTRYSTSGVITKELLKNAPFGDAVRRNVRMETKGHQKRATDVTLGILDAAIIWDAVAFLFRDKLDVIPIEKTYVDAVTSATFGRCDLRNINVTTGVTSYARDKEHVRKFYQYLTTEGLAVFEKHGFSPPEGRLWKRTGP